MKTKHFPRKLKKHIKKQYGIIAYRFLSMSVDKKSYLASQFDQDKQSPLEAMLHGYRKNTKQ